MAKATKDETAVEETGTEVAVQDGGSSIAVNEEMLAEMRALQEELREEIDLESDIRLPALALLQATTKMDGLPDEARPGRFHHTGNDRIFRAPVVVICRLHKTRTRWSKQLGELPLCSSPDAKNGYGDPGDDLDVRGPNGGGSCQACPESKIRKPDGDRGTCKLNFNYIAILVEADDEPVRFANALPVGLQMKSTSAKTAQRLNANLLDDEFFWSKAYELGAVQEENEHGVYQVWRTKPIRDATPEEQQRAFYIAKQLQEAMKNQRMIEIVDGDGERSQPVASAAGGGEADGDDDIPF